MAGTAACELCPKRCSFGRCAARHCVTRHRAGRQRDHLAGAPLHAGIARDPAPFAGTGLRDPDAAAGAVDDVLALPDPPTALFTSQNLLTIGGVHALRRAASTGASR